MKALVQRKAKAQLADGRVETRWLEEWRGTCAYVLLGDPGSGKTESLRQEAEATGGVLVSARLVQEGLAPPVSPDATVFIDAMDEARGGKTEGQDVLGAIGRYLIANGRPRFRMACREADWRGAADRQLISHVAPADDFQELHLEPLSDGDIRSIASGFKALVPDTECFLEDARRQNVYDLLRNPLLLELMLHAATAGNGRLPRTRLAVYEAACRRLAEEHSPVHRQETALQPGVIDTILDDAGTLCSILLLSGLSAVSLSAKASADVLNIPALPQELALRDPARAIRSKVFSVTGDLATPRHRTIAEYLAAHALAKRVREGLPLSRVLALIQGFDGHPVESMRGLSAWLAVLSSGANRERLITLDPLGFIVNGDAAALTYAERVLTIRALSEAAGKNRWFRDNAWVDHPFGPLATADMEDVYAQELGDPKRLQEHQVFIDCLLDALKNAPEAMPRLAPVLAQWVEDSKASEGLRITAYEAWLIHSASKDRHAQWMRWLDALSSGAFDDPNDRLLGRILRDAYPAVIQEDVLRFFRPTKRDNLYAEFSVFWGHYFTQITPAELLPALGDAWVRRFPRGMPDTWNPDGRRTAHALLAALLDAHGDTATGDTLYDWLGIGLDEHGMAGEDREQTQPIADWLNARPEKMKEVVAIGYGRLKPDAQGRRFFWEAEARLHHAMKPRDWIFWQMAMAERSDDTDFVQWAVTQAAWAAAWIKDDPKYGLDAPGADEVHQWVAKLEKRFPQAPAWLQNEWTVSTDDWRAKEQQRNARYRAERSHAQAQRKKHFAAEMESWPVKPLSPDTLYKIAMAYQKRYTDIRGDTPRERVADLLGGDAVWVDNAIQALDQTLAREDLPSTERTFELASQNKQHLLRTPALLAAERAYETSEDCWRHWTEGLQVQLTAYWLSYDVGEEPAWFKTLCAQRPEVVAPVLLSYVEGKLQRRGPRAVSTLWHLPRDGSRRHLATLVLPRLLEFFPYKAPEAARNTLNRSLLPGLTLLPQAEALALVHRKLALKSLDPGQRICWLVALLPLEPSAADALTQVVGKNQRRIAMLGTALHDQEVLSHHIGSMPASSVQRLIELLAPLTIHDPDWPGGFVTPEHERESMVQALFRNLGTNPRTEAGDAIRKLLTNPDLGTWQTTAELQLQAQLRLFREASFKAGSPEEVARLLCNGPPANAADLLALLVDHVRSIADELRNAPFFQLPRFWKDDHTPRGEEDCRDLLLAQLAPRLQPQKINVQAESRAAAAKRMDLRATAFTPSGRQISIPVEAKKDNHSHVWTAWRTQLQELYAIDPSTQGLGLYLVFWFGTGSTRSPEGYAPASAADLEEKIRQRIPEADRPKLHVVVMDLSWPATAKRPSR